MYLTTMWVRNASRDRGVNIFVHWHPGGLSHPDNPWRIADEPGPVDRRHHRIQLPPGGNSVDAFLDVILADDDYALDRVARALEALELSLDPSDRNPLRRTSEVDARPIHVIFSVNLGLEDIDTRREVFKLLRENLTGWLGRTLPALPPVSERAAA